MVCLFVCRGAIRLPGPVYTQLSRYALRGVRVLRDRDVATCQCDMVICRVSSSVVWLMKSDSYRCVRRYQSYYCIERLSPILYVIGERDRTRESVCVCGGGVPYVHRRHLIIIERATSWEDGKITTSAAQGREG